LGYKNHSDFWYKLDDEWSDNRLHRICNDSNVITLIGRIQTENRRVLHLYVEHKTDVAYLIDPTEQPANVKKWVEDEGGVEDVVVEKGVGEDEGVGEDSSDDPNYEASGDEKLSGYETTNAEDEDLYTTITRGKNKEDIQGKLDWFGVGAAFNAHDGDVVSSDSADSEWDMESLSS